MQPRSADASQTSQCKVLIADDNADALESLALLLECEGHTVIKATNGLEAFELASATRPQVAFLDIGMPVMTGYEAATRIRSETWGKELVLVALSGWGQREDVHRSKAAGFDSHLVKPASFEALNDVLSRFAGRVGSTTNTESTAHSLQQGSVAVR
jgi:CheY-like chemotaxis protein